MPEFVRRDFPRDEVYDRWLSVLQKLEESTISTGIKDTQATDNSFDIGYKLFPVIDSIGTTLFDGNGRKYLKELGYSDAEADLTYLALRNGLLHGMSPRRLIYEDGEVSWSIFSSSGSGGFTPHNPGDEYFPPDKGIDYFQTTDGEYMIWIFYDKLLMHIRHDIEKRKRDDEREMIGLVIGEVIPEKRRTAPTKTLEDM
ncbi:hypothetical protein EBZ38_08945 [bacterium]|nr:hypothetical protein [bacterium]NDD84381.1 hypothetical protein [bacterium]